MLWKNSFKNVVDKGCRSSIYFDDYDIKKGLLIFFCLPLNSLPNNKFQDWSEFKAFADLSRN